MATRKNIIVQCKMHGHLTELPCEASDCPLFGDCRLEYEKHTKIANEKRLIEIKLTAKEAEDLIHGLNMIIDRCCERYEEEPYLLLIEKLKNAPTVDAVEVVHGRWEQMGEADYRCPVCGFRFTSCDPIEMFEYCRCGTKMDGDSYV